MSKVRQHTQPLSCSRHKRNGCMAQAQAALPTMMSGLDGCLRADVTWVGEGAGEKEEESFSAAQCWRGTVAEQGAAWSASLYLYKSSVCLFVCLSAFYRPHDICPLCGAASESRRAGAVAGGPAHAWASACTARARARMPYNFSTKKSLRCMPFKNKTVRARMLSYT